MALCCWRFENIEILVIAMIQITTSCVHLPIHLYNLRLQWHNDFDYFEYEHWNSVFALPHTHSQTAKQSKKVNLLLFFRPLEHRSHQHLIRILFNMLFVFILGFIHAICNWFYFELNAFYCLFFVSTQLHLL